MGATRTQWKLSKSTRPNSQDRCFCQTSKSNSGEPVTISRYRAHHLCLSASKWLIRFQNIMVKYDLFRPLWPSSLTSWHPKLTVLSPFLAHHLRKFAAQSVHSFFKKLCSQLWWCTNGQKVGRTATLIPLCPCQYRLAEGGIKMLNHIRHTSWNNVFKAVINVQNKI